MMIYKRLYTLIATLVASTALLMILFFSATRLVSAEPAALSPANLFSQPPIKFITVTVEPTTDLKIGDVTTITVSVNNTSSGTVTVSINDEQVDVYPQSPNQPLHSIPYTITEQVNDILAKIIMDGIGGTFVATTTVTATAVPPAVSIDPPNRLDGWKLNELVTLALHLTDKNVTGVTRTLTVTVNGDNPKPVTIITGTTVTTTLPVTLTEYGDNPLIVEVTNQYGLTDTDTITFKTEANVPELEVTTTPTEGFKVEEQAILTVYVTDMNYVTVPGTVTVTVNGKDTSLLISHTVGTNVQPVMITIPVTLTQVGANPFTVTVTNQYGLSATETVTITADATPKPSAPQIVVSYDTTQKWEPGDSVPLTVTVTDLNRNDLGTSRVVTVTVEGINYPVTITIPTTGTTGMTTIRVTLTQVGANPFTVTVTNQYSLSETATVTITAVKKKIYLPIIVKSSSITNGEFNEELEGWDVISSTHPFTVTVAQVMGGKLSGNSLRLGDPNTKSGSVPTGYVEVRQELLLNGKYNLLFDYQMYAEDIVFFEEKYSQTFEVHIFEGNPPSVDDNERKNACQTKMGYVVTTTLAFCNGRKRGTELVTITPTESIKIDLTRFEGKTISVVFRLSNLIDGQFNAWVAIDNVRLEPK